MVVAFPSAPIPWNDGITNQPSPAFLAYMTDLQARVTAAEAADATIGSVFLSSQVVSSSTSVIVFTGLNSAVYEAYKFVITGLKPTNTDTTLVMRFSVNNGVSYLITANGWVWTYSDQSTGGGPYSSTAASDATSIYLAFPVSSTWGCHCDLTVYPSVAGANLNSAIWQSVMFSAPPGGTRMLTGGVTEQSNASPVNAVAFFFGSGGGNITSGRITMYGLRKS